jgi:hypothetical protein
MSYIIVWRNSHREPHVDINSRGFKEDYLSHKEAKEAAEKILKEENENKPSEWYFDYQIYEAVS